jgi:hypothetical protein
MQRRRRGVPNATGPMDDLFGYTQTSRAASVLPTPIDDELRLGQERPDRFELVADHTLTLRADRHVVGEPVERDVATGLAPLEPRHRRRSLEQGGGAVDGGTTCRTATAVVRTRGRAA